MDIFLPDELAAALANGAPLVVSVSGGKDSDAMALRLAKLRRQHGWTGEFILIHADLGRMEWEYSLPRCRTLAARLGAEFVVVRRDHDLLEGMERRHLKRPDAPPFPSAKSRYCTSDWKRNEINKWLRGRFPSGVIVVSAMGLRAEESSSRAKKNPCELNELASALTKDREVWNWLPIHEWTLTDVWAEIGLTLAQLKRAQSDYRHAKDRGLTGTLRLLERLFPAHPAYLFGNERVSCALCILASENDLRIGAEHNPELAGAIIRLEDRSGFTFRHKKSLKEIIEAPNC